MSGLDLIRSCIGFEWDDGNADKNWVLHRVKQQECEQLFFNRPLLVTDDVVHAVAESRWYSLGQSDAKRALFVVFTVRGSLIRVIFARDMTRREREVYRSHG